MLDAVKSYFYRVHQRYKSQREGRTRTIYTITHNEDAMTVSWLTIENETGQKILHWRDVVRVQAFKRDVMVVDMICLAFTGANDIDIEIYEEMSGFDTLVQTLPTYLPGCQKFEEWFFTVAFPAFELNLTTIYERGSM